MCSVWRSGFFVLWLKPRENKVFQPPFQSFVVVFIAECLVENINKSNI